MEFLLTQYEQVKLLLPVLTRVSVTIFMFPFFNSRVFPVLVKAGLALLIAMLLLPVIDNREFEWPSSLCGICQIVGSEIVVGMILGILIQIVFEGVRIMGQVVGFQTGFAITNILDPQSGVQVSIVSNMAYISAMILFLMLNGHHILLDAMKESFQVINAGSLRLDGGIFRMLLNSSAGMFVIALKLGAPAIAIMLLVQVAFGLVIKLIPQMNIMIVAYPVQIVIGLVFFGICLNMILLFMERYLAQLGPHLIKAMGLMKA